MSISSPLGLSDQHRKRRRQSSMSAESPREVGHMRMRPDTGSASFVGSSSGIHFVRTVRQAFAKNSRRQSLTGDAVEDELVPGEDDRLHLQNSPDWLWRGDEVLLPDQSQNNGLPGPTFDDMVHWSRPYFSSWHPQFPYLHAPTFLGLLEKVSIHTLTGINHTDSVIVRSIMSISVADRRQTPSEENCLVPANLLYQSIEEALSSLQPLLTHPSSLPALQAAVSIQLFLISMLRLNAASRIGGLIVRMSYHLGLHRCPSRFSQFSTSEIEIRRRVFWSIYSIERYLSQALGLPLELKDDDLDVCFPDQEFHGSGNTSDPGPISSQETHRLLLPTYLARHGRIKGLILELRNKSILHSRTDPEEVSHIDTEISKWWNDVQELLNHLPVDNLATWSGQVQVEKYAAGGMAPQSLKPSHKLLLLVQKHELVILLNRPVITSGHNTPAHILAIQKCIGASKAIIYNVYQHINGEMNAEGAQNGRIHNPLSWPGFVWMVWQSGLIILYAAFEGHYSVQIAQREAGCCVAILQNLALRGNVWPSACGAAIKELQASLDAKMVANSARNQNTAPRKPYTPKTNRQYAKSQERIGDRNEFLTQQYNIVSSTEDLETQSQAGQREYETGNRGNRSPDEAAVSSSTLQSSLNSDLPRPEIPHSAGRASLSSPIPKQGTEKATYATYTEAQSTGIWPAMSSVGLDGIEQAFTGSDDIFQLMDVPYLFNDQFLHAQPGILGLDGFPSIQ